MVSKAFLYLCLLLAVLLLISSEVAARDLAETSTGDNKKVDTASNGVDDEKYGGNYGGYPGQGGRDHGGRGDYPGGGGRGGSYPRRGRCYYGCCRRSYYGRECLKCCSSAGEAVDSETQDKPHN